jgi:16S rRNA (cytidine1402-2'-O)-methyltransferase
MLQSLKEEEATLVFYIPTRKLLSFLEVCQPILGDRQIVIAREMTKIYEEFLRGKTEELRKKLEGKMIRGEATVLIEGKR